GACAHRRKRNSRGFSAEVGSTLRRPRFLRRLSRSNPFLVAQPEDVDISGEQQRIRRAGQLQRAGGHHGQIIQHTVGDVLELRHQRHLVELKLLEHELPAGGHAPFVEQAAEALQQHPLVREGGPARHAPERDRTAPQGEPRIDDLRVSRQGGLLQRTRGLNLECDLARRAVQIGAQRLEQPQVERAPHVEVQGAGAYPPRGGQLRVRPPEGEGLHLQPPARVAQHDGPFVLSAEGPLREGELVHRAADLHGLEVAHVALRAEERRERAGHALGHHPLGQQRPDFRQRQRHGGLEGERLLDLHQQRATAILEGLARDLQIPALQLALQEQLTEIPVRERHARTAQGRHGHRQFGSALHPALQRELPLHAHLCRQLRPHHLRQREVLAPEAIIQPPREGEGPLCPAPPKRAFQHGALQHHRLAIHEAQPGGAISHAAPVVRGVLELERHQPFEVIHRAVDLHPSRRRPRQRPLQQGHARVQARDDVQQVLCPPLRHVHLGPGMQRRAEGERRLAEIRGTSFLPRERREVQHPILVRHLPLHDAQPEAPEGEIPQGEVRIHPHIVVRPHHREARRAPARPGQLRDGAVVRQLQLPLPVNLQPPGGVVEERDVRAHPGTA
ncbi:hypothetical protein STIAU_7802, partial [Stigmatella aurantiaca DW4/3-1]